MAPIHLIKAFACGLWPRPPVSLKRRSGPHPLIRPSYAKPTVILLGGLRVDWLTESGQNYFQFKLTNAVLALKERALTPPLLNNFGICMSYPQFTIALELQKPYWYGFHMKLKREFEPRQWIGAKTQPVGLATLHNWPASLGPR
ncbi:hypothetical protein TMatcc_003818 [Talaromyces marneffei ATCC 18224]